MPACRTEAELEDLLSTPSDSDIDALRAVNTLIVLGAAGKMGPSLARRARRAATHARIVAVSRSTFDAGPGIEVLEADLLDRQEVEALPDADCVVFMAGRKFGSTSDPSLTWAANVLVPALAAERYRASRIVAVSSGNVYPFLATGATEETPPDPSGEYAWSVLARERVFEHFSARFGTLVTLARLNYAIDLRYGVLVDMAQRILAREPIDLNMARVNVIWQGDANSYILRSLNIASSPPRILNVAGPEIRVRDAAEKLGRLLGVEPVFTGAERETSLLNDASLCTKLFGPTSIQPGELIEMVAEWLLSGGRTSGKPTHYETRDGRF